MSTWIEGYMPALPYLHTEGCTRKDGGALKKYREIVRCRGGAAKCWVCGVETIEPPLIPSLRELDSLPDNAGNVNFAYYACQVACTKCCREEGARCDTPIRS